MARQTAYPVHPPFPTTEWTLRPKLGGGRGQANLVRGSTHEQAGLREAPSPSQDAFNPLKGRKGSPIEIPLPMDSAHLLGLPQSPQVTQRSLCTSQGSVMQQVSGAGATHRPHNVGKEVAFVFWGFLFCH